MINHALCVNGIVAQDILSSLEDFNITIKNLLYVTVLGSRAHGFSDEKSDIDIRGIYHDSSDTDSVLGVYGRLFPRPDCKIDSVIYGLNKFFAMAIKCNPFHLELLGTREQDIVFTTEAGNILRENKTVFLSADALYKSYRSRIDNCLMYSTIAVGKHGETRSLLKLYGHAIREQRTAIDILNGLGVITHRPHSDVVLIRAIRSGVVPIPQVKEILRAGNDEMLKAYQKTLLPRTPNFEAIESLRKCLTYSHE